VRTAAEQLAGKAVVVQVNTQESPYLAGRFNVRGVPVVYLLRGGRVVDQIAGARTAESLLTWFKHLQ